MKASWRRRFIEHEHVLRDIAPGLALSIAEVPPTIGGILDVPIGAGRTAGVAVRITFVSGSPFRLPLVFLADNTFTRDIDRHIAIDGWLCMWLPQTAPTYFHDARGLEGFIGDLRLFLVLQFMYDDRKRRNLKPFWAGPEWEHGDDGHRQWVREHVGDMPLEQLRELVHAMYRPLRRTMLCPCGRRRPYGSCHLVWLRQLRHVVARAKAARDELDALLQRGASGDRLVSARYG